MESQYIKQLRQFAHETPVPKMPKKTENKIIDFVNVRLRKKYPNIVKTYMTDLHEHFDTILKAYAINKILVPADGDFVPQRHNFDFKFKGKTLRYDKYLKNREKLKKILLLPYPFIKCILNYAKTDFPNVLNDYGVYKKKVRGKEQWLLLSDFQALCSTDLTDRVLFLKKDWYPKIVRILKKHYRRRTAPVHQWRRIIDCAKGLINRQITELKMRTFEHLFEVILDNSRMPYIKLQTICLSNGIDLNPTFDEIYATFKIILMDIERVGGTLPVLEAQIDMHAFPTYDDFLVCTIGDVYMTGAKERLFRTLQQAYAPVLNHLEEFRKEYYNLYCVETQEEINQLHTGEVKSCEEYLAKIDIFHNYVSDLRRCVQNEFFSIATVNQTMCIAGLRTIAQGYIQQVTENIVDAHQLDCKDICKKFIEIKARAMEIPLTTEMLLANGEYMLQTKEVYMKVMQSRIQNSLRVSLCGLFYF